MKHYFHVPFAICLLSFAIPFSSCQRRDPSRLTASGTLDMTDVYLSPTIAGRVSTLSVREGDSVTVNQRLGTLDRFVQAQKDFDRSRRLVSEGGSTREQVENAELAWRDQQLVSPINGVILNRISEPGEVVTPGTPVVVIGDPTDIYMRIYVSEKEVGRLRLGQEALLRIDAFPDRAFKGKVTFISPKAEFTPKNVQTKEERVTQMFAVKIAVSEPDGHLKAGMPADVEINTAS